MKVERYYYNYDFATRKGFVDHETIEKKTPWFDISRKEEFETVSIKRKIHHLATMKSSEQSSS